MAYRPSRKRKTTQPGVETNITPVMNLVVVLIPLLLSVAQFVNVSLLDYQPPPAEDLANAEPDSRDLRERLELVINVVPNGFEVSLFGATSGRNFKRIPLTSRGVHDIETLRLELVRIRRDIIGSPIDTVEEVDPVTGMPLRRPVYRFPDAEVVNVAAKGNTPWQLVVSVMDAARSYTDERGSRHPLFALPRLGQIQ
ncbi:MAG: hypothetical protein V2A56_08605 [bacterium]